MFAYSNFSKIPRRELLKRAIFLFFIISFSSTLLSSEKYFDRNQLPQLSQEILDQSQFEYIKEVVDRESIIPVQTQRVIGLRVAEKKWLLKRFWKGIIDSICIDFLQYMLSLDVHQAALKASHLGFGMQIVSKKMTHLLLTSKRIFCSSFSQ